MNTTYTPLYKVNLNVKKYHHCLIKCFVLMSGSSLNPQRPGLLLHPLTLPGTKRPHQALTFCNTKGRLKICRIKWHLEYLNFSTAMLYTFKPELSTTSE